MDLIYEKVWIPLTLIKSEHVRDFIKSEMFFMKNIEICFFIAEITFTTSENVETEIDLYIPELSEEFIPCENTILVTKNDSVETFVRLKLEKGKLQLISYPFDKNSTYEVNLQLFMRSKINGRKNKN